jgi:predicted Rossmann-fold nucleotide-binding protein
MRVLVCGGRGFKDKEAVFQALDTVHEHHPITSIIQGGATGADTWAAGWAFEHKTECLCFVPDWKTHGKAAGPIRNQQMLREGKPDLVVALPGGAGTADMVRKARSAGIKIATLERVI